MNFGVTSNCIMKMWQSSEWIYHK